MKFFRSSKKGAESPNAAPEGMDTTGDDSAPETRMDDAAPPPMMPKPMWGNKKPTPAPPEEALPSAPPPKPMWGNKKPTPAPPEPAVEQEADAPPAAPPPRPMWGNKKPTPPAAASTDLSDGAPGLPPGMPKPMWGQKSAGSAPPLPGSSSESSFGSSGGPPPPMWGQKSSSGGSGSGGPPPPMWGQKKTPPPAFGRLESAGSLTSSATTPSVTPTATPTSTGGGMQTTMMMEPDALTSRPSQTDANGEELPRGRMESVAREGAGKGVKPQKVLHAPNGHQYALGEKLGQGSYAKVKLCEEGENKTKYAVKIFKVSLLKRRKMWDAQGGEFKTAYNDVEREIAIMRKLNHKNVMSLHDVVDEPHKMKLYMVMDYCPNGAIMDSEKMPLPPLSLGNARKWFADTVVGLEYLHFQGVVHYDLKPDNILIADDGHAIIADFGVSRVHLGGSSGELTIGSPGTPTYTAPEVWGSSGYNPRIADVWSLGCCLFAMIFGYLPYYHETQVGLIALVQEEEEWSRKSTDKLSAPEWKSGKHEEYAIELIKGMLQKKPDSRWSLEQVASHPWITDLTATSKAGAAWEKIELADEDVQSAIGHGHMAHFKRTHHGTIWKLTDKPEDEMYRRMHQTPMSPFLPQLVSTKSVPSDYTKIFIELEDLVKGLELPCLMDVKMGTRTYKPGKESSKPRKDMLEKLLKISPDAASDEEREKGVTKNRYLEFRDRASSTYTLGFRIDLVQLDDAFDETLAELPSMQDLKTLAGKKDVAHVIGSYMQRDRALLTSFLSQVKELRSTLEGVDLFQSHSFLRSSLLFVYDGAALLKGGSGGGAGGGVGGGDCKTKIKMIDFPRVEPAMDAQNQPTMLDHRSPFSASGDGSGLGNGEDGYLFGLDNMVSIFESLLEDTTTSSS